MSLLELRNLRGNGMMSDRRSRSGFSMFEVMVAMAVCVSGIVLIIGMMQTAENFTKRAQTRMTQQMLCQNLMNQVLLGIIEPREIRREECPANEDFWFSMRVNRYPHLPMQRIEVAVWPKSRAERTGGSRVERVVGSDAGDDQTTDQSKGEAKKFILVSLLPAASTELSNSQFGQNGHTTGGITGVDNRVGMFNQLVEFEQHPSDGVPTW